MIIYKIQNKENGMIYIGQTTRSLEVRIKEHATRSRCPKLHNAIKKYGIKSFSIEEIDNANTQDKLNELESFWVEYFGCISPNGYNLKDGGGSAGRLSQETKDKISASKSNMSEETRAKMSAAQKGRTFSPETIQKMRDVHGNMSEETRAKMSASAKTKVFSEDHKNNLSLSRRGKKFTDEHKARISAAQKGRKMSDETKAKIRAAQIERLAKKRCNN